MARAARRDLSSLAASVTTSRKPQRCWPGSSPSSCQQPCAYDKALYRLRNCIERCFARLKPFRRIATRFDRKPSHFLAFLYLASIPLWVGGMSRRPRARSYQLMSEAQSPPSFIASWLVPCLFIAATLHPAGGLRAPLSEPFPVLSIRLLTRMIRIQNVELPFFVSSSGRPCRCPPCRAHASRFSVFLYWQLKWQRTFFLLFLPAVCWRWVFRAHAW